METMVNKNNFIVYVLTVIWLFTSNLSLTECYNLEHYFSENQNIYIFLLYWPPT